MALIFCLAVPLAGGAAEKNVSHGKASWYGTTAHGKKTANGEIFSRYSLTAAHKTLPFGTVVRVHNLRNGRQILVRINDRGPFAKGRIVDVSRRAAEELNMITSGVANVAMEVISNRQGKPLNPENSFYLHLTDEDNASKARALAASLEKRLKKPARSLISTGSSDAYSVCLGPYDTFKQAQNDFHKLEDKNIDVQGIIEAPTHGKKIPLHTPPQVMQAKAGKSKKQKNSAADATVAAKKKTTKNKNSRETRPAEVENAVAANNKTAKDSTVY